MTELYVGGTTTSLTDWDTYVSYVIFFAGCNFRCQYCHNPELIGRSSTHRTTVDEVLDGIKANKLIDAVVYSGGEPTEQNRIYLTGLAYEVYHKLQLPQKLDTNGSGIVTIEKMLPYLDKVSLDLKAPPNRWKALPNYIESGLYSIVTGVDNDKNDSILYIDRTLKMVGESKVTLEGRTTVVPELVYTEEHIRRILDWASPYLDEYTLQAFRNDVVYNPVLKRIPSPTREHMEMLKDVALEYLPTVNIRPRLP